MNLSRFQHNFKALMFDHPNALKVPDADLAAQFASGDIALHERLAVYRNNIVGALSEGIISTFPLLRSLVGESFLRGMARKFVLAHPPTEGCLNHYGAGFDDFVRGFKPAEKLPYLGDVAQLELAVNDAYYAPDDAPLTAEDLGAAAAADLGGLLLKTRASVSIARSRYPLMDIRTMCLQPDDASAPDMNARSITMVHRPALKVLFTALADDEAAMLDTLNTGAPLGEAVERVLETYPRFDFQAFLQKHLALETFRALPSNTAL